MEIEYIDQNSGKVNRATVKELDQDFIGLMSSFGLSDSKIKSKIDSLNISADSKVLLNSLNKFVFTAGKVVIKIGKKIIDVIFALLKNFPYLSFGVICGLVLGALISAIPLLGAALGALATSIAVALGFVFGGLEEFKSEDIKERIDSFIKDLSPLQA